MGLFNKFKAQTKESVVGNSVDPGGPQFNQSIFKATIPRYLYNPPFGHPRNQNIPLIRRLGSNAYVHSIISTIQQQVGSADWDVVVNDGEEENPDEVREIKKWFNNPNGNSESFAFILRAIVKDILELDSGVLIKVFDGAGNFKQVFARDGGSFLMNPDMYGYLGNREDFIPSYYYAYDEKQKLYYFVNEFDGRNVDDLQKDTVMNLKNRAAYFQYGLTSQGMPIPFGKAEVVWFSIYPQTNNVYGRSPLEVLGDVIYTLIYGATFNLDMYLNNNVPDGVVQLLGANSDDIKAFRERWQAEFVEKDIFNNERKKFFKFPISNTEVKFTPFVFDPKQMQVLEQQAWFWKLACACFNVTPSEMGFTEDSNKATEINQSSVFKRKAIQPLLQEIEYKINLQIMPHLDPTSKYKFKFDEYDIQEDLKKYQLLQMQISMGVKTAEMVAEEEGIDVSILKAQKEEKRQQDLETMQLQSGFGFNQPESKPNKPEEKTLPIQDANIPDLDDYFNTVRKELDGLLKGVTFSDNDSVVKQVE